MSDADQEAVTVSADGITVRKTVDAEQFQTLAVVIELASEREDGARVQVIDAVPSGIPMDDVGFHPDYGAEHWSVDDGTVAFERDLEPGEAYTTIYGIRDYPKDEIEALLGEPEVGLVDIGSDDLDAVIDEDRSEAVREFISGEADLPGLEDEIADAGAAEAADSVAEATESPPAEAPAESEAAGAEEVAADAESETPAEPEPAAAGASQSGRRPPAGGVVRVLIKELREGDIDDEDRRLLRDELLDVEGTTETRVGHLQQRVSDLEAYTDALEEFIDEEGTAEQVITDLRDDIAGLEREVRSAGDRLDEAIDGLGTLEDRIDAVGDDVGTVRSRAAQLDDRLEDAEDDIAGVDRRADDLDARLDGLSANVDAVDDRVSDVDERVEDLRDELNTLRRNLRNDIQALEDDLEDFEEFRDRLSSVFGGPGGPGGSADQGDGG
jgi:predicted  nucleic acid-binding Zn-ribbon protein